MSNKNNLPKPITRIEMFLNKIIENGGGNPNSVEEFEGTLADLINETDFNALYDAISAQGEVNAVMVLDASALGYSDPIMAVSLSAWDTGSAKWISFITLAIPNDGAGDTGLEVLIGYEHRVEPHTYTCSSYLWTDEGISELSEYASLIPATLTIYWHPMPGV